MRLNWDLPLSADGVSGELDDGTPFVIRPIRATDGHALETAFGQMSPRSRYLRFFTVRQRLGEYLVSSLVDIDHDRHRAWVVADPTTESDVGTDEGRGIAVARLAVVEDDPKVAEGAVAVVDDMQGHGFGNLLLDLLVQTALDTGVDYLRFETLGENRRMRAMLNDLGAERNKALSDQEVLVYDLPLHDGLIEGPAIGALYDILRWIAASADEAEPNHRE